MFTQATMVVWSAMLYINQLVVPAPQVEITCGMVNSLKGDDNAFLRITGEILGLAQAFGFLLAILGVALLLIAIFGKFRSRVFNFLIGALAFVLFMPTVLEFIESRGIGACSFF